MASLTVSVVVSGPGVSNKYGLMSLLFFIVIIYDLQVPAAMRRLSCLCLLICSFVR